MKIAVVGAGFFGITAALKLSNAGHRVTLFDSKEDILSSASRTNQLRLHRGYHYPRSEDTVKSLLESLPRFLDVYGDAAIEKYDHHYAIASSNSYLSGDQYISFLEKFGLEYEIVDKEMSIVNPKNIDILVKVKESLLDYHKIYEICRDLLLKSNVSLNLNKEFFYSDLEKYDKLVNCTYSSINKLTPWEQKREYQFEVCEKICVEPTVKLNGSSLVVMDGPFMCIDPYGSTGKSLLGNVVHAIHSTNIGHNPIVPDHILPYLNRGILSAEEISNFSKFINSGSEYISDLGQCKYVGSMFTVRAVLPYRDSSDERPTIVTAMNEKIINVFSGKIDTCVTAADQILELLS